MPIVPDDYARGASLHALIAEKIRVATDYVQRGWAVFVLGRDKSPLKNCDLCAKADWQHVRQECGCLTCHGFYAATRNIDRYAEMIERHPFGYLAVRTGLRPHGSGLVVIDFEAAAVETGPWAGTTGLEIMDRWEGLTGTELPPTLQQRTGSGGLHLLYETRVGFIIKSHNRVLPKTDIKAEGGYVAVPTPGFDNRHWITGGGSHGGVTPLSVSLLMWLLKAKGSRELRGGVRGAIGASGDVGGGSGGITGYDYKRALTEGVHDGERDEFFNDMLFRLRKLGATKERALDEARKYWSSAKMVQPPQAAWFMPFEHVEYKIERIWQTVEPGEELPKWRPVITTEHVNEESGVTERREDIGRVSIIRSRW